MPRNHSVRFDPGTPRSERDRAFCLKWLEHFDARRAYKEAGFKFNPRSGVPRAAAKLARFAGYLEPLRKQKEAVVVQKIALDRVPILDAMMCVAFANAKDYFVQTGEPVMGPKHGRKKAEPLMIGGEIVYQVRAKPINELTREQLAAVEVRHNAKTGELTYRLPDISERHQYLQSLGQEQGLFMPDEIKRRQQAAHLHGHIHFDRVPSQLLGRFVKEMATLVGPELFAALGLDSEQYANESQAAPPDRATIEAEREE